MSPFRMYGTIVEIYRFKVTTPKTDNMPPQVAIMMRGDELIQYAHTEEEANQMVSEFGGTMEVLDTSGYEWMEGLEFPTRDEAIHVYEAGQEAYLEKLNAPTESQVLNSKIDYLSMMSGIEIPGGES